MSRPVCADTECERSVVRYREGVGYCLFHPDATPPVIDPKTGKPVVTTPLKVKAPNPPAERAPRKPYRAPGRVVEPPAAKPTPADVATAYDDATQLVERHDLVADRACPVEGCTRTAQHRGWHTKPKPAKAPKPARAPRAPEQPPADGRCTIRPGCAGRWRHRGRHTVAVDGPTAARRYLAGEGLFQLAADLHVGANTLRTVLVAEGVTLRARGDVIGTRGPAPRSLDVDECKQLYATGMTGRDIATRLGVKARRVYDLLRDEGILGPPGGREPGPGSVNAVRVKLDPAESAAVRDRARHLGLSMNAYLRGLILTDLATVTADDEEQVA